MDKGLFLDNLKKDLDAVKSDLDTVKSDIAEMKAQAAETLDLVRQAWSAGTLDNAIKDLREALDGLADFGRVATGITAVKQQLDNVGKFSEKCDMITDRLDRVARSMDARYGRKWANPLLRHAVKTGVVVIVSLAGVGMYHVWPVIRAAFK
jgi:uncharacterized membrane protein YccC